jgi:hypothetical protein
MRQGAPYLRVVRIGRGPDVAVTFNDGLSAPERQRPGDHFGCEDAALGEVRLDAHDFDQKGARALGLVTLDDHPSAVRELQSGDAADARLMKQSARDARPQVLVAEYVDRPRDLCGIITLENGQLDEGRRRVPFAQVRGDDRSEMRSSRVHAITVNPSPHSSSHGLRSREIDSAV